VALWGPPHGAASVPSYCERIKLDDAEAEPPRTALRRIIVLRTLSQIDRGRTSHLQYFDNALRLHGPEFFTASRSFTYGI
jgi:hypothetical protein